MNITKMKLADLTHPEKNVRIHTKKQIAEFARSLKKFDQLRPIIVDENNVILAGNGQMEALLYLGEEEAYVKVVSGLSEGDKKRLMIADNRIFSLGTDNLTVFEEILEELNLLGEGFEIPGYDEELLKSLVSEAEEITEKISTYGTLDAETIQAMKEAGARKEEQDLQAATGTTPFAPVQPQPHAPNFSADAHIQEGVHPPQQTVKGVVDTPRIFVCPHCGKETELV